jgi:uncharacterized membrane protein
MNPAHLHLVINHLPIIGSFIGLSLIIYSHIVNKNTSNLKAGLVILAISCFTILPVYFSGEAAEDIVEHLPGITHDTIEEHEELAELGLYISLFIGLLSSITFLAIERKSDKTNLLTRLTLFGGAVLAVLFVLIGHTGGEIRHPEIEQTEESTIDKLKPKLNIQDTDGD